MLKPVLNIVTGAVAFALLFVAWVYPEVPTATYTFGALLVVLLGVLAWLNQKALKEAIHTRSMRYGTNALVTIGLVIAILVVVNFLNYNHFYRKDLTKNKTQSLSEQTTKILKDLKQDIKLTVFVKSIDRESVKSIVQNYSYYTKKITAEYVDPDRERERASAADVKKYGTVIVSSGKRETRIDDVNEEKLTNAILKVLKDKAVVACFMVGHGEKGIDLQDPDNYSQVKKELGTQNYEAKSFNLLEEGKIPEDCSVLLDVGPTKAFFDKELALLKTWLDNGGRALFAIDPILKPGATDFNKGIKDLLSEWYIQLDHNLVIDPTSRLLGVNASVPIVGIYSKEHPITKDFQVTTLFPIASTLNFKPGAPGALKTSWIAKSTPKSFAKDNFREIATGQVHLDPKKDKMGPFILMAAVEGGRTGDKKPAKPSKIVVVGTSQVASNRWVGHGANLDLFLNSVSWLADDESLISIRPKDESLEVPSLSQTEARYIQLLAMIVIPGGILLLGLLVWMRRRKL